MNTLLTADSQALKEEFTQFAKNKLAPIASALLSGKASAQVFWQEMAQASFLGLNVPTEYGGKNSPFLHLVLLAEILANYDAGLALTFAYHVAAIELIKSYGSDKQKQFYLPQLANGQLLGSLAYLEFLDSSPNGSKNSSHTKVVSQDNTLLLSGQKEFVVLADEASANDVTEPQINKNLILVAVDNEMIVLDDLHQSTIKIEKQKMPMSFASVCFARLIFDNHSLMPNSCLGKAPENIEKLSSSAAASNAQSIALAIGEKLTFARNIVKTLLAATALGMSTTVLNKAIDYSKINQRGDTLLSQSQAIQWKLADAATETSAARLLTYRAAWSKDENSDQFFQYATMAKAFATRVARIYTSEGLQIILPFLQNLDSPLTSFYVDSKILETFDAPNEEEKVVLSKLLGI